MFSKLRAKLGLAPLEVGNDTKTEGDKSRNSDSDFVHAPAKDLTKAKQSEKLQEKIATAREKRELLNKLREVKSLGSGEETNVSSWVEKMRAKEKAKQEAEKRVLSILFSLIIYRKKCWPNSMTNLAYLLLLPNN